MKRKTEYRVKNADAMGGLVRRDFVPLEGSLPKPLLLGIDPGFGGAIVVYDCDRRDLVDVIDLPLYQTTTRARKSGLLNHLDIHKVSSLIDQYAPHTALCALEEPGAMPNQGLSSTFRFGHVCGAIHGVMAGHYIPVVPIKPGVWKSALNLSEDKDRSRDLASEYFANGSQLWPLKKHNDRAEAALLCIYASKYLSQVIKECRR